MGDLELSTALLKAAESYRHDWSAFLTTWRRSPGQGRFEIRSSFQNRLTDYQKRLWSAIKHGVPAAKLPPAATVILDRAGEWPTRKFSRASTSSSSIWRTTIWLRAMPNDFYQSADQTANGAEPAVKRDASRVTAH